MSLRCPGMGLPPASASRLPLFPASLAAACPLPTGLGGWPGMACPLAGEMSHPSWSPGLGSSWSPSFTLCLAPPGVRGPSGAAVSPPGQRRGPRLRDGAVTGAPWGEFQAQHSREGAGAGGGRDLAVPVPPPMPTSLLRCSGADAHGCLGRSGVLLGGCASPGWGPALPPAPVMAPSPGLCSPGAWTVWGARAPQPGCEWRVRMGLPGAALGLVPAPGR